MKRSTGIQLAGFAAIASLFTTVILLCSVFMQQLAIYLLDNNAGAFHH
jgi:hypothetical protein